MNSSLYTATTTACRFLSTKATTFLSLASAKVKGKRSKREPTSPKNPKLKLTDQQNQIVEAISNGNSVFITGSAGTGKTYLLQHVITKLRKIHGKSKVFVTASTGVAACSLNGQTLHSFAGIGIGDASAVDLFSKVMSDKKAYRRWNKVRALVIDEISMIRGEVFDSLEFIARNIREEPGCDKKIWGGIQLVVSGDFFQLPPVIKKGQEKEFAFEADCWNASFDMQFELKTIFRQSDTQLIKLLQGFRKGKYDSEDLQLLDQCCSKEEPDPSAVQLYPRIEDVNRVNTNRLERLGEVLYHYQALDSGKDPWIKQLNSGIAPELLKLCVGARVLLTKNLAVFGGLVNGATGTILEFAAVQESDKLYEEEISEICQNGSLLPVVKFDCGKVVMIGLERWYVMDGDRTVAMRNQIPLILAWALSIHKCQGMTLNKLHTDLYRAFGFGMVYVALSRVKSLEGLRLVNFNPWKIKAHPKVLQFYQRLSGDEENEKGAKIREEKEDLKTSINLCTNFHSRMSGTADDTIQRDTSLSSYEFDTDDEVQDHPLPRVRIKLSRSYFDRDDLWLPACLSPYIPAREVTVIFRRGQSEYYTKCYPRGNARRIRHGWLEFLRDTDFRRDDMLDLVLDYRSSSMIHFTVINNDPRWVKIAQLGAMPPILFQST